MRLFIPALLLASSAALAAEPADLAPGLELDELLAVGADFMRANPCPSTGKIGQPCKGYSLDWRVPPCAGGKNEPGNMQWLRWEEVEAKNRRDEAACREASSGLR